MNPLRQMLDRYLEERTKLDVVIEALERELRAEKGDRPARPARKGRRVGRHKSAKSITSLAEKALTLNPEGLMIPALIAELQKLGFESKAADPSNVINSVLHRHKPPFRRLENGRWILEKYARPNANGAHVGEHRAQVVN